MGKIEEATCVVRSSTPAMPGPAANILYNVHVQTQQGVFQMDGVESEMGYLYPANLACTGATPGTHHRAQITGDQIRFFIPAIPTTITCEDIE